MKILCVGGGSGGHVTPIAAVVQELKSRPKLVKSGLEIRVWCDRKFSAQAKRLLPDTPVQIIAAGKLRRYANLKWWYRWFSPWHIIHTHIPNLIDLFKIWWGFNQSFIKLLLWRPDVVFCKGGYVSLPVGLAAHLLKIRLVIHDSDSVPGLTNRILSRFADQIGTGAPVKNYPGYPKNRTKYIGIPVSPKIHKLADSEKKAMKKRLGLDDDRSLVLFTGGGLGAVALNNAVRAIGTELVKAGHQVVLVAGKGRANELANIASDNLIILDFTTKLTDYMMVADVVVTRAGATTMAELAAAGVATIIVPSPYLAGDHQTKNARVYEDSGAAVVLAEKEIKARPEVLQGEILDLLIDDSGRKHLAQALTEYAKPHALGDMVDMIIGEK